MVGQFIGKSIMKSLILIFVAVCLVSCTSMLSSTPTEIVAPTSFPTLASTRVSSDTACWPMENVKHRSLSGSLLYYYLVMDTDTGSLSAGAPAILNLKTGSTKGLRAFLPKDISPDGKMLAEITGANWIFLTEEQEFSYPIPDVVLQKSSTHMFLPNGQMLWEGSPSNPPGESSGNVTRDLYMFSPDTGKLTFVQSVVLPYSLWNPSASHNDYHLGAYSPNLRYVLYPANYKNTSIAILLNVKSQKIVWYGWSDSDLGFYRPPLPYYTIETPIWKPDSSGVIFHRIDEETGIQNLYYLSVDGQVSQLTRLEELFPTNKYIIASLSISPNGHYLAFALIQDFQTFPQRNSSLLILDLDTGTMINPCVNLANSPYPASPIWSPDSSAIVIMPDSGNAMVVVDLNEKALFSILSKAGLDPGSLLGWINWEMR
jgi:hypothetical protein